MQSKNFDVFGCSGSECPGSSGLSTFSQLFPVGQGKRQVPRSSPWRGELHKLLTRRAEARRTAAFATVLPDDIEMVKSSAKCYAYTPGVELRILSGAKKRSRERAHLREPFLERPEAADGVVPTDCRLSVSKKSSKPAESSWVDLEAGEVAEEAVFPNSVESRFQFDRDNDGSLLQLKAVEGLLSNFVILPFWNPACWRGMALMSLVHFLSLMVTRLSMILETQGSKDAGLQFFISLGGFPFFKIGMMTAFAIRQVFFFRSNSC